jgi:hypothetical protein
VVPPPHLKDRYRNHGAGIVHMDPDSGEINLILEARDSRRSHGDDGYTIELEVEAPGGR